jgi:hypothetical protein
MFLTASAASQPLSGFTIIHSLPAGTYDFSVRFKSSSGSVTAKNRKLWVASIGFE